MQVNNQGMVKVIGAIFSAIFLGWCAYAGLIYWQALPVRALAYQGVMLGDARDEVLYALGQPSAVIHEVEMLTMKSLDGSPATHDFVYTNAHPEVSKLGGVRAFKKWRYELPDRSVTVIFDTRGNVRQVGCSAEKAEFAPLGICSINGIQVFDGEAAVMAR